MGETFVCASAWGVLSAKRNNGKSARNNRHTHTNTHKDLDNENECKENVKRRVQQHAKRNIAQDDRKWTK